MSGENDGRIAYCLARNNHPKEVRTTPPPRPKYATCAHPNVKEINKFEPTCMNCGRVLGENLDMTEELTERASWRKNHGTLE